MKQIVIQDALRSNPIFTVLDIGCGDVCWFADNVIPQNVTYLGVDISDEIIAQNRRRFATLTFEHLDVFDGSRLPFADLVLCFDVLIHQQTKDSFSILLSRLLAAARLGALVSYLNASRRTVQLCVPESVQEKENDFSDMYSSLAFEPAPVFFHGELAAAVRELSLVSECRAVAQYRRQSIYAISKVSASGPTLRTSLSSSSFGA